MQQKPYARLIESDDGLIREDDLRLSRERLGVREVDAVGRAFGGGMGGGGAGVLAFDAAMPAPMSMAAPARGLVAEGAMVMAKAAPASAGFMAEAKDEARVHQLYDSGVGIIRQCMMGGKEK